MLKLLLLLLVADSAQAACNVHWDGPANVTNGNDFRTIGNLSQAECAQLCCSIPQCVALSWNYPQEQKNDACTVGGTCCFLKDTAEPPVPNPFGSWVHTASLSGKPPITDLPTPSALQERFMKGDWSADGQILGSFTQFMHFSVTTFGDDVEHDCYRGKCLSPELFQPDGLDTDQWVAAARAMGASEICLTAHHEGGFMLAPTPYQQYGVAQSSWMGGKGDVLKQFVASARAANISICYYISPSANGFLTQVAKDDPDTFVAIQLNLTRQVLQEYGPVRRLWWDHFDSSCGGLSECPGGFPQAWPRFVELVRQVSPDTIIGTGPDVGHSAGGESGVGSYPRWNACNTTDGTNKTHCSAWGPLGWEFKPREADATIQNPGDAWFYHPDHKYWSANDIWQHFVLTWGRGDAFILNMPPNTTGVIPDEYVAAASAFGDALRASFARPLAHATMTTPAACSEAVLELDLPNGANAFMTRETMTSLGQRIATYTIEVSTDGGSTWKPLPAVDTSNNMGIHGQTVGYRIVDLLEQPVPAGAKARVRCLTSVKDPVHFRDFGAYNASPPPPPSSSSSSSQ